MIDKYENLIFFLSSSTYFPNEGNVTPDYNILKGGITPLIESLTSGKEGNAGAGISMSNLGNTDNFVVEESNETMDPYLRNRPAETSVYYVC